MCLSIAFASPSRFKSQIRSTTTEKLVIGTGSAQPLTLVRLSSAARQDRRGRHHSKKLRMKPSMPKTVESTSRIS
eukprot:6196764-Pleurochrysis_carterae.AAC.2